jgi:hypothetical protein
LWRLWFSSHFYFQYGEDWYNSSPRKLCMKALTEYMEEPDQEVRRRDARVAAPILGQWRLATEDDDLCGWQVVILSAVLVHEINYGYQQMTNLQLLRFNDQKVRHTTATHAHTHTHKVTQLPFCVKIKNLKQLAKLVAANKQPYLRFDFDEHVYAPTPPTFNCCRRATGNTPALRRATDRVIILEADAAKNAEETILTRHRIPSPHSPDLFDKEETDVV